MVTLPGAALARQRRKCDRVTGRDPGDLARDLEPQVARYRRAGQSGARHISEQLLVILARLTARTAGEP